MQFFVTVVVVVGALILSVSFYAIRYASHRPANGELKTLKGVEEKLETNRTLLHTIAKQHVHYKHTV